MAEIVGVLASGIMILGASIKAADALLDFVSQVRNAPEELSFLHNEVADTRLILLNIEENTNQDLWLQNHLTFANATGNCGNPESLPKGDHLIRRVERILVLVNLALRDATKLKSRRGVTIHYGCWLLHRSKIKSLRNELHELKTSLSLHFCTNIGSLAVRSVIMLKRVLLENSTRSRQGMIRDNRIDATLQNMVQKLSEVYALGDSQRQIMTMVQTLHQNSENEKRHESETGTTPIPVIAHNRIDSMMCNNRSHSALSNQMSTKDPPATIITTAPKAEPASHVEVEFSCSWSRGCIYECQCICHRRQRYRSPSFTQKLLGEMFIAYSNLPSFMQPCSDTRCRQRSPFSFTLTYYLSTSLFNSMVLLLCVTTPQGDLAACLKMRPSNPDFALYRAVKKNDIETVRRIIERCVSLASATFRCGWTPLHYAVTHGHVAMCKSLIAAGADPSFEDSSNDQSPLEWAWIKILGASYPPSIQREMELLFSDRTPLASLRFPRLHRIILNLHSSPPSLSLAEHLTQNPQAINARDATGRTALSRTAQRGMADAVSLLLAHGADPNLCSAKGHSALQYAATAQNPDCIAPLLRAGADVHQRDVEGQTALHYAAMHQPDLAYYIPLIQAAAHIDAQTRHDETPLSTAISQGYSDAVTYLVEAGADINLQTFEKRSPVFNAVETNSHAALKYLLDRGARYEVGSTEWPSVLHVAAMCDDVETLEILTAKGVEVEEVGCVDREGRTVERIVEGRAMGMKGGDEWERAWRVFRGSVVVLRGGHSESEAEESEDVFYDAVEELVI